MSTEQHDSMFSRTALTICNNSLYTFITYITQLSTHGNASCCRTKQHGFFTQTHVYKTIFWFLKCHKMLKNISYYLKTRKAEWEAAWLRSIGLLKGAECVIGPDAVSAMQRGGLVVAFMTARCQVTPFRDMWRAAPLPLWRNGSAPWSVWCHHFVLAHITIFGLRMIEWPDRTWFECIMDGIEKKLDSCFFVFFSSKKEKIRHSFYISERFLQCFCNSLRSTGS